MPSRVTISQSEKSILDSPGIPRSQVTLWWLGQAGFALEISGTRILIDPYLSDSLANKYAGTVFPHRRMIPIPITPQELSGIDVVMCTHRHSDHMDPGTLPLLHKSNPKCMFVVPRAEIDHVLSMGLPHYVLSPIDAGESLTINSDVLVKAIPSAHETVKVNEKGQHHFLGYVLSTGMLNIYHSGDCIPYDGLVESLRGMEVDVGLLPVNGRDESRSSKGVPGNFTIMEARDICVSANIQVLLAHHFGMFDFNTVDPGTIRGYVESMGGQLELIVPQIGIGYTFSKSNLDG